MKKVVLGLFVLLSVDGECMKLSQCECDAEMRDNLFYRLLEVAPNSTVDEVVGRVAGGASAPSTSSSTPVSTGVAGDDPIFDSLRAQLQQAADERSKANRERDEAKIKVSRLEAELRDAASERDAAKADVTTLSTKVGQLEASSATLRTRVHEACDSENKAKKRSDDLESELRLLYGTLVGAGYKEDQKGADVVKKSDFDKARADLATVTGERDQARTDLGTAQADLATAQTNLTTVTGERDTARADLATAQANLATVTGERDTARADLATAQANLATVTGERDTARTDLATARTDLATVTGERDTAQRGLATAQTNLAAVTGERDAFLGVFTGEAHLADIDLRLLRAVFASNLTLDIRELKNAANPLSQLGTVGDDAGVQGLPNAQGLDRAGLQDPASDMVKFALLRGFFHSATYVNHDQAELNGLNVTCTDGPISLGTGGLDLKVE